MQSIKIGVASCLITASALDIIVKLGIITSSPFFILIALRAISKAAVPFETATEKFLLIYFENSDSITTSKMRSSRILVEYDCREKKSRYLSYQAFKEPDLKNAYPQDNRFDEWSFIAPGTLAAITLNIACKK